MRKIRIYRRKIIIETIVLLLIVSSIFLYLEKKEEIFLKDFRYYVLAKLEKELDIGLEIQHMDGGFFDNITLDKIKLTKSFEGGASIIFEADNIDIYYRLWAIAFDKMLILRPFKRFIHNPKDIRIDLRNAKLYFFGSKPFIADLSGSIAVKEHSIVCSDIFARFWNIPFRMDGEVFNSYADPTLNLRLEFEKGPVGGMFFITDHLSEPNLQGNIKVYNNSVDLNGRFSSKDGRWEIDKLYLSDNVIIGGFLDFVQHLCQIDITIENQDPLSIDYQPSLVKIIFDFARMPYIKTDIKLDHVKIGNVDLLSNLTLKTDINIVNNKLNYIRSELVTSATIVNYKPFKEIEAFFELSDSIFRIVYFKLGDNYNISGKINFDKPPYEINSTLFLNRADPNDLVLLAGILPKEPLTGLFSGKVNFSGQIDKISTKGNIEIKDGQLAHTKYNTMAVEVEGIGSVIDIKEARMFTKEGSTILLDGKIDLKRISAGNPVELKLKSDQQNIVLGGFDITKEAANTQLSIGKNVAEDMSINFKTFTGKNETSFNKGNLSDKVEENERLFSIERRLKF